MKPGDLRRFKDGLRTSVHQERCSGRPFMVLETSARSVAGEARWVSFLVDGLFEERWGYEWIEANSEVIDETR